MYKSCHELLAQRKGNASLHVYEELQNMNLAAATRVSHLNPTTSHNFYLKVDADGTIGGRYKVRPPGFTCLGR